MPGREYPLVTGETYHIFNRGITQQVIFSQSRDYDRILSTISYYQHSKPPLRYSFFMRRLKTHKEEMLSNLSKSTDYKVILLACCLMPNHFHFLLKQNSDNGISDFISQITNSYTRYFNTKHKRIGPLFQGRFKAVLIESEEQLIHLSRYIHLNPYSSGVVSKSSDLQYYPYSSFRTYLGLEDSPIYKSSEILSLFHSSQDYQNFVLNQSDHQRQLQRIKHLLLDI